MGGSTMFNSNTPYTLLVDQVHTLRSQVPGVRDGDAASVHDARVATRRIRELLQFADGPFSRAADEVRASFRTMGRALGRVRDADVRITLLAELESRVPHVAPRLVTVRQSQEDARLKLMRLAIKRLERLEIENLLNHAVDRGSPIRRMLEQSSSTGHWRRDLCRTMMDRGRASAEAIEHATGVYFPNRAHAARIALKKLRYAMEIAGHMGNGDLHAPLRDLKKGQDVLGDLHDRQALLDDLTSREPNDSEAPEPFGAVIKEVLEAEVRSLHGRYLARRERLLDVSREAQAIRIRRGWRVPTLVSVSALALSSGAYVALNKSAVVSR